MRAIRRLLTLFLLGGALEADAQGPSRAAARATSGVGERKGQGAARIDSALSAAIARALAVGRSPLDSLSIALTARIEAKAERTRNERCFASARFRAGFECRAPFTPSLDAQFNLRTSGQLSERTKVDVDYDSQREFDGSNNLTLAFNGKANDKLQKLEVGNVTFQPPRSRFITSGIPAGNFGVQTGLRLGALRVNAIAAQQKGNVTRDQVFHVGGRTRQPVEREVEDYQIEPRRFFFTVDPALFGEVYPNIDILNGNQMAALSRRLPDNARPIRVRVYRLILGGQPPNPNGPRFQLIGDPSGRPGQPYEVLREGIDYYLDPSQLWLALVRPLALNNERLVVAYSFHIAGRDTVIADLGGTPDLEVRFGEIQRAHLLWDPSVTPSHPAFRREIRSVYRLGGEEVDRASIALRIVAGTAADQEKPPGGVTQTYLQLFGLSQRTNPALFDGENRVWPRPNDPNYIANGVPGSDIFRDRFVIFPSLEPFARRGLAAPLDVVSNDTIYHTPSEYLYSPQHPQSFYRLKLRYDAVGGAAGSIALNSLQIRPGSENIVLDGRLLTKGIDYEIDYELGRIALLQLDTLSGVSRRAVVRYEENPLFVSIPTSVLGISSELALGVGTLSLVAISQSQRTTLTRPPLGLEPQASFVGGVAADFAWNLMHVPTGQTARPARLRVKAELAVSKPLQRGDQQAFIESFEADGGVNVPLLDTQWQISSLPALGHSLGARIGAAVLDTARAAALAFQSSGTGADGRLIQFTFRDVDPLLATTGVGVALQEEMLWLSLYPLSIGGKYQATRREHRWLTGDHRPGRRWRSVRTIFGAAGSGIDLSRGEQLEFWTLIDTSAARRGRNPTMVFDFGEISENAVALAPDSVVIVGGDSLFYGRHLEGYNRLDSERDRFSRAFNADVNDRGIAGDVVDRLKVVGAGAPFIATDFALCALNRGRSRVLGDTQANCTVRSGRLEEEDIDQDATLNFSSEAREAEVVRRFVVDLSDRSRYTRVGKCGVAVHDVNGAVPTDANLCWVQVRIPFTRPDDSTGAGPNMRRVRALRMTMISGATLGDDQFSMVPIARLRVVGASWLRRSDRPLLGAGGTLMSLNGAVAVTAIGTQDRDSTRGLFYESPPGVVDQADNVGATVGNTQLQVNERSLRVLATELPVGGRAEAYFRFPEGQKSVMGYRELRLWARGRGNGWGLGGELQAYVKVGRDADNFYLYRTPVDAGASREAWLPEIRVRFERFLRLRARLETAFLRGDTTSVGCTGADSLLIARSGLPRNVGRRKWAMCEDGYVIYTVDPAVAPPNLAGVQELAAGILRVDSLGGTQPLLARDTAEVWIDDIRLADAVNTPGYAAEASATMDLGDLGSFRIGMQRRDPNFRQLGDAPSFRTGDDLEISGTWRLDRWMPASWGLRVPLSLSHRASRVMPQFITQSDIQGSAVPGLRTPASVNTIVSFSARREGGAGERSWSTALLDALVVEGDFSALGDRTAFQNTRLRDGHFAIDFATGRGTIPASRPQTGDHGPSPWFVPTFARVSNTVSASSERRQAFLEPADAGSDPASQVRGADRALRATSTFEWSLSPNVVARVDMDSEQDLRLYDGESLTGNATRRERASLFGVALGLERERTLNTHVVIAPAAGGVLRPRLSLGSTYAMIRDPNNPSFFTSRPTDSTVLARLARRIGNTQFASATMVFSPATLAARITAIGTALRAWQPVDVTVTRSQLAAYDGVPVAPGVGFQLGAGAFRSFRNLDGFLATNAGMSTDWVASTGLVLPVGVTLNTRVQLLQSDHWQRHTTDRNTHIEGEQRSLPDVSLRWSGRPQLLSSVFESIALSARLLRARQEWVAPPIVAGAARELRRSEQRSVPLSFGVVTAVGRFALSGTYALRHNTDSLPGSVTQARAHDLGGDIAKSFRLPAAWGWKSPLRARVSYQESAARSLVSNAAVIGATSRLTDNGRRVMNLNFDSEVTETSSVSVQGARVLAFDRNLNRRVVQTFFTAVFQLAFFGGAR